MSRKYFGTDGIRGKVGEFPITPDFALRLGFAAGKVLVEKAANSNDDPAVVIGKDTRISGYMFESALEAGFSAAGVDVFLAGPIPTPGVAYLTRALRLSAGVVISASHNPFEDNGIKFFAAGGKKLPDEVELEIEAALDLPLQCKPSAELGKVNRLKDSRGRYIEFCKSVFPNDLNLNGLRIVVDCANGATYRVAPSIYHELGAEVIPIGVSPNGVNINQNVGVMHPDTIIKAVLEHQADLGIAFDGDGDRVFMVDSSGRLYDGDEMIYIIATAGNHAKPLAGVVGTLMSNFGLERALADKNISFHRAKVGDRYVLEKMLETGWTLGGENSGHIICLDSHVTGDGIISSLYVLNALCSSNKTLAELTQDLKLFPQKLINVPLKRNFKWKESLTLQNIIQEAESILGNCGRVLLRPSGTEPLLRVMVEGEEKDETDRLAQQIADVLITEMQNF